MLNIAPLSSDPKLAIEIAAEHAPYLARLSQRVEGTDNPDTLYQSALDLCHQVQSGDQEPERALRDAKKTAHLAIAAKDLSGMSELSSITADITKFADHAVQAALTSAIRKVGLVTDGLFVVALGKMGAYELNYSSDIDMAAFYNKHVFVGGTREPGDAASRVIRDAMQLLSQNTADGYVFRTDLRLRPDPSSTPLAVSTQRAELYYESVGQNWERMVWIKGRSAAGDLRAGVHFIEALEPFVWRRHLDYWAIADVHAIKSMINAKTGPQSLHNVASDIKLGPGGIREIEFFVQTQQIILGGRNPSLRMRGTLAGLEALVASGAVEASAANELRRAYEALRAVEHRIQMLDDAQTHTLPSFETKRAAVAALCGYSDLETFDTHVFETRRLVHRHYQRLFAEEGQKRQSAIDGNLVFTGVDDDPGTLTTLSELGFSDPATVIERIREWHRGRTSATRTIRGRELLTAILPDLLATMSRTGEPDEAFRRFSRFLEGLRSGVQTLSMLVAETDLMEDLITTLAIAPQIAETLAKRPSLLETLLSVSDLKGPPDLSGTLDFETAMNVFRRWHSEQAFLTGHSLLHGKLAACDAAQKWSQLADTAIKLMAKAAEQETIRRYGPAPGVWAIVALGKLGGREMTAGSDLDLIVIYDADDPSESQTWFTRFTQRLIAALSAETGEGRLYEVDMRLRPSGRAGPVATSLAAFERYHRNEAWTWEHMALTRARAICGDEALSSEVVKAAQVAIHAGDASQRRADILDMRRRLDRDKPATGDWDLKMRRGALVDLEFIVQCGLLTTDQELPHEPQLLQSLQALQRSGDLDPSEFETLTRAFLFLQALQQVQRMATGADFSAESVSRSLKDRLCRAAQCPDFERVAEQLEETCDQVAEIFCRKIGDPATELQS